MCLWLNIRILFFINLNISANSKKFKAILYEDVIHGKIKRIQLHFIQVYIHGNIHRDGKVVIFVCRKDHLFHWNFLSIWLSPFVSQQRRTFPRLIQFLSFNLFNIYIYMAANHYFKPNNPITKSLSRPRRIRKSRKR